MLSGQLAYYYATRLSGYFRPPITADYRFWLQGKTQTRRVPEGEGGGTT